MRGWLVGVGLVLGCGEAASNLDGGIDATTDAIGDGAPSDASPGDAAAPVDCGTSVQPVELADAKYCPYQADGGTSCPVLGDYCCEPQTGDAICSTQACVQIDAGYNLKCSAMNMGCDQSVVPVPCCIDAIITHRGVASCGVFEGTPTSIGTFCGTGGIQGMQCNKGEAQVCATSAECNDGGGGTCAPLVLFGDGGHPLWLGVCLGSDGGVVIAP